MTLGPQDIEGNARKEAFAPKANRAYTKRANGHDVVEPLFVERSTDIKFKPGAYRIKGIVEDGDFAVLFGPSGGGKTFVALDIGHAIATGRASIFGRRVKQAPVLLCSLEGARGLGKRVQAINREIGPAPHLYVYRKSLVLFQNDEMVARLAATIQRHHIRVVIIDTLARAMAGGKENAPEDMGAMIKAFGEIAETTGAHVMIVHHTGKDESKGGRGHNSLKAAADVEIEVTGDNGDHIIRLSKVKDGQDGERFAFKLRVIHLGVDDDGDDITTCVVEETGPPQSVAPKESLLASDQEALGWLREAVEEHGERPPIEIPAGIKATTKARWTEIGRKRTDNEADTVLKAVNRAITRLTNAKVIGVHAPYFWVTR
jgi:hypothetical protein